MWQMKWLSCSDKQYNMYCVTEVPELIEKEYSNVGGTSGMGLGLPADGRAVLFFLGDESRFITEVLSVDGAGRSAKARFRHLPKNMREANPRSLHSHDSLYEEHPDSRARLPG
jgi:hypothetical protein